MVEDCRPEAEQLRRTLFGGAPERCTHSLPVRLVVEGPMVQPVIDASASRWAMLYTVTAYTDGKPEETFTTGNEFIDHDAIARPGAVRCTCREVTQQRLERILGSNVEYNPRSGVYVATWRLVPPRAGDVVVGRNLLGYGTTVENAFANLAVLLRRGEEVVH